MSGCAPLRTAGALITDIEDVVIVMRSVALGHPRRCRLLSGRSRRFVAQNTWLGVTDSRSAPEAGGSIEVRSSRVSASPRSQDPDGRLALPMHCDDGGS